MSSLGLQVKTSRIAISPTVSSPGRRFLVPIAMQMSRSVSTPISFPSLSTTGSMPTLRFHISSTALPTFVSDPQQTADCVMISLTFMENSPSDLIEIHLKAAPPSGRETSGAHSEDRTVRLRHNVVGDRQGCVPSKRFPCLGAHDDEVRFRVPRPFENFFGRRAKGHAKIHPAPVLGVLRHEVLHPLNVHLAKLPFFL